MPSDYTLPEAPDARSGGPRISLLSIVAVLFLGFALVNTGITISDTQAELHERKLQPDDRIEYHYTVSRQDGSIAETSVYEVALRANEQAGLPIGDEAQYVPRQATLDPDQPGLGWGESVERAVLDAHIGQTIRVQSEAVDDWELFIPDGLQRELGPEAFQRTVFLQEPEAAEAEGNRGTPNFDLDELEQAIGPVENGTVYNPQSVFPPSWDIAFEQVNRDNRSVILRHTVEDGQYFDVQGIPGGVRVLINENETAFTYHLEFEEDGMFTVSREDPLRQSGLQPGSYHIREVTEDRIMLYHHESMEPGAVGQPVTIEIQIIRKV